MPRPIVVKSVRRSAPIYPTRAARRIQALYRGHRTRQNPVLNPFYRQRQASNSRMQAVRNWADSYDWNSNFL